MKTSSKVLTILSSILLIITGIISLSRPGITLVSIAWIIGVLTLLSGVMAMVHYFYSAKGNLGAGGVLFFAIANIIMGIVFLGHQLLLASILPFVFAFWITFSGIERIIRSLSLQKLGFSCWWIVLLLGLACAGLGISTMFQPVVGAITIGMLVGVGFILQGITYLTGLLYISKAQKSLRL